MRHNFRELLIWKEEMALAKQVYELAKLLPQREKFSLISQINRCAISIPSNIAEGSGRTSDKEFNHFLNISLSSSYELETQFILIHEIYTESTIELISMLNNLRKMIGGFKKTIN